MAEPTSTTRRTGEALAAASPGGRAGFEGDGVAPIPPPFTPIGVRVLVVVLTTLLACGRLVGLDPFGVSEGRLYDGLFLSLMPEPPTDDRIVIVEVDDRSLADLRQRWPLERATWAAFIRKLQSYNPRAVAIDAVFELPEPHELEHVVAALRDHARAARWDGTPGGALLEKWLGELTTETSGDLAFADAMSTAGNVTLGLLTLDRPTFRDAPILPPPLPGEGAGLALHDNGLVASYPGLALAARSHGTMRVLIDEDGSVRRYPYVVGVGAQAWPSLALATVLADAPLTEQRAALARMQQADGGTPTLRFRGRDQPWPKVSFSDVMLSDYTPGLAQLLSGKIVFVGVTATATEDVQRSPLANDTPGVLLHATALENYVEHTWLERFGLAAWATAGFALILLGGLAVLLGRRPRARIIIAYFAFAIVAHVVIAIVLATDVGALMALIPTPLGLVALVLCEVGYRWVAGRRERAALVERQRLLRAERAVLESFRRLVEHVGDAMVTVDTQQRVRWMNPAAEVLFRRRTATTLDVPIAELVPRLADPEVRQGRGIIEAEARADLAGPGAIVPVEATATPMEVGSATWTNYVFRDIGARKALERQKDSFVAGVNHELRTPLTSILGALRLVEGGALGEVAPAIKELLVVAERNGERLLQLVNDLLDAAKIAAGKLVLEKRPVALGHLVEQAIARHFGFAARFGVTLASKVEAPPELVLVVDEERILDALANLLSNAVKHSPEGGTVELQVTADAGRARFAVVDHGPGIAPEHVLHLFEKFTRAAPADGRRRPGTGLGLALAKELVEAHGGTIRVRSEVGLGSTFEIDLPLESQ